MHLPRRTVLLLAMAAALLMSMLIDLHLTTSYPGVDLRDKVVGSRSLLAGRSLYYDPWRPGDPEELADPMLPPGTSLTRFTGTPFQALLTAPLAPWPFRSTRLLWFVLQYALLIGAVWMVVKVYGSSEEQRTMVMAAVLVVIMASRPWHLHVERGQVYVLAMALMAGLFAGVARKRDLLAGVLAAALVLLKPTYGLIALPLVVQATRRLWIGGIGFLLVMAGVFALIPDGLRSWVEYGEAMKVWSSQPGMGEPPVTGPADYSYPAVIEGITDMQAIHPMEFEDGSALSILSGLGKPVGAGVAWALFAAFLLGVLLLTARKLRRLRPSDLLLLGFCCWSVLMMLLPTPRFDYQVVQWVAPMAVVLLTYPKRPFAWNVMAVFAAALIIGAWEVLPVDTLLAEAIMLLLIGALLWERMQAPPDLGPLAR